MSKLYALAMSASYQDGEYVAIDTLAAVVFAKSQDEAVEAAYDYVVRERPPSDGWRNYGAAVFEIPEEML